jgi:predicted lactoylglutathione lyase
MNGDHQLITAIPVLISDDVQRTIEFYAKKLGFQFADHQDKDENFASIYRDSIELIIVKRRKGEIQSNNERYGKGFDAYFIPRTEKEVDDFYEEFSNNDVKIIEKPRITSYGCYEFEFQDIDRRNIGIGIIVNREVYFKRSNFNGK